MRGHHSQRHSRRARTNTARAFRRYQRPRHRPDRRRRALAQSGQTHPGRNRLACLHRRRPTGLGGAGHRKDAERFPLVASGFDRLKARRAAGKTRGARVPIIMLAVPNRHRSFTLLVTMLAIQLLLLAIQIKRETQVRLIRIWAVELVAPLGRASAWTTDGIGGVWSNYVALRHMRQQNDDMQKELDRLKLRNAELEGRAAESDRLAQLL